LPQLCRRLAAATSEFSAARRLVAMVRSLTSAEHVEVHLNTVLNAEVSTRPFRISWSTEQKRYPYSVELRLPISIGREALGSLHLRTAIALDESITEAVNLILFAAAQTIRTKRLEAILAAERREAKVVSDALQETHHAMIKHRQVGRMGDFRYNTRTKESFGTIECYWMFGNEPTSEEIELAKHPPYVIPLKVDLETWTDQIVAEDQQRVIDTMREAAARGDPYEFEYRILVGDEVRHIAVDGALHADHVGDPTYYGVMTDVTDRKRSEESLQVAQQELTTAQRLASLGELAASIIHEVSQPITAIRTGTESCVRWMEQPGGEAELRSALQRVAKETVRASSVIGGLRALAKGADTQLASIDIMEAAEEAVALVRSRAARGRVTVQTSFDRLPIVVRADRVQLQQVLINLANNAVDAMAASGAEHRLLRIEGRRDGQDHVRISVIDTGPGIALDDPERLFDPLYSTKNEGMGLGLAICRRIVTAHHGQMSVRDNKPRGAIFEFQIPTAAPNF
jgi:C4-dicarboxylate-specific signal transduction histidine kinase